MWLLTLLIVIGWKWRETDCVSSSYQGIQCPYMTPCDIEVKLTEEIEALKERLEAIVVMEHKLQQLQLDFNLHLTEKEDRRSRNPLTRTAGGEVMPSDEEVSYLQMAELQSRVAALDKKVGHLQQKMSVMQIEYSDALSESNEVTTTQVQSIEKRVTKTIESQRMKAKEEIADIREETRGSIDSLSDKVQLRLDTVDSQVSELRGELISQKAYNNVTFSIIRKAVDETNSQMEKYNKDTISRVKETHLSTKLRVEQLDSVIFRSLENLVSYQKDMNMSLQGLQTTVSDLNEEFTGLKKYTFQQVNIVQRYAKTRIDDIMHMIGSFSHSKTQEMKELNDSIQQTLGQMKIQMDDLTIDVEFMKNLTLSKDEPSNINGSEFQPDDTGSGAIEEEYMRYLNNIQGDSPVTESNCTYIDDGTCIVEAVTDIEEAHENNTKDNETCFKPIRDWMESLIYEINQNKTNELAVLEIQISTNISMLQHEIQLLRKERSNSDYYIIVDPANNVSKDLQDINKLKLLGNLSFEDDVVPTLPPLLPCSFPITIDPMVLTSYEGRPIIDMSQKFPSGSEVMHRCQDIGKYLLLGDPVQQCHNGTWNGHKHLKCEKLFTEEDVFNPNQSKIPSIGWNLPRGSLSNRIGVTPEGNLIILPGTQMILYCLFPKTINSINLRVERPDGSTAVLSGRKNGNRYEYTIRGFQYQTGVYTCENINYGTIHSINIIVKDVRCPELNFDADIMEPSQPIKTQMNSIVTFHCLFIDAEITWSNNTQSDGNFTRCLPSGVWSRDLPTCN